MSAAKKTLDQTIKGPNNGEINSNMRVLETKAVFFSFLFFFVLTTLTQWSTASSQLEAPPSSSAGPHALTAVTVSMAPTVIRESITAR